MFQSKYGRKDGSLDRSGNFNVSALPTYTDTLWEHLSRVNNLVGIWKRVHVAKPFMPQSVRSHRWAQKMMK